MQHSSHDYPITTGSQACLRIQPSPQGQLHVDHIRKLESQLLLLLVRDTFLAGKLLFDKL